MIWRGRGRQLVLAADHVRHRHGPVVHRVGQHEERLAVALHADEVLQRPLGELDIAPHQVVHLDDTLVRRAEAQRPALSPGQPEVAAVAVVARRRVAGRRPGLGPLVNLLACAAAGVERAAGPQGLDRRVVRRVLLRLEVRALVGRHAQPVEGGDDPVGPLGAVAHLVGVLNAQHEGAAVLAHEEPVEERGPGAADVEVPGR